MEWLWLQDIGNVAGAMERLGPEASKQENLLRYKEVRSLLSPSLQLDDSLCHSELTCDLLLEL